MRKKFRENIIKIEINTYIEDASVSSINIDIRGALSIDEITVTHESALRTSSGPRALYWPRRAP